MADKSVDLRVSDPLKPSTFELDLLHTAKGGGILAFGRLFNYLSRFAITFVLARILGAEQYGLYNLAITGATIAGVLAMFGLDQALTRYIAIAKSRRDTSGLWGALQVGVGASMFLSLITSTALFAFAYPLAEYAFHEPRLAPLLQIASLVAPFLTLSNVLSGATRGFKNMRDTVLAENILQPTVRFILIVVVAFLGLDVAKAILIYGIADFSASVLLVFLLNKHFHLNRPLGTAKRDTLSILGFSLPLWLSNILTTFRGNLQTLLIGSLNTVRGVGIFSITDQVNLIGNIIHVSIIQSAKPLIAELDDLNDRERLVNLYQTATKWSLTMSLPFILIMMLFPAQILSIFGKSFMDGAPVLVILAFVNLINVGTGMCGAIIDMTGHTKLKLANSTLKVGLSIVLNFLLIPRWGIVGAAVSALIYEFVSNVLPLLQVWFLYKLLPFGRNLLKPILAGAAMLAAWLITSRWFPPDSNLLLVLLDILLLFAVYTGSTLLMGFSPEEHAMLARFRRKLRLTSR